MLSIGIVAQRAGLNTSALRYYERLGLVRAERRSGRRVFDERVLDRLTVIRYARGAGFSLREINTLLGGRAYSRTLRALAKDKIGELEARIAELRAMQLLLRTALRCNCLDVEACGARLTRR